jgi:ketosteroid isomerase-like protein
MSRERAESVYELAAAVGTRDIDTLTRLTFPQVEWHTALSVISEGGAYHGHDGVRQYLADLEDAFEAFEVHLGDVLVVGSVAIAVGQVHYHGKASGVEQAENLGWVVRFRDDGITYVRAFRDPERVLDAVGLSE